MSQEGLPEEDEAWSWDEVSVYRNGRTKNPPNRKGKWWRWYFIYHKPTCTEVKINADQDPSNRQMVQSASLLGSDLTMAKQPATTVEHTRLSRRIKSFYRDFNKRKWEACFQRLDPKLKEERVDHDAYVASLASFFDKYGPIQLESLKLTLHLDVLNNRHDDRPFAYGMLRWRDKNQNLHILRERWVNSCGTWYTRMAGLL
jgi:hypothetical protein